jgi:glutathione S-transferase
MQRFRISPRNTAPLSAILECGGAQFVAKSMTRASKSTSPRRQENSLARPRIGRSYAVNRYRREAERHYQVLNDHLHGRDFIAGDSYTIADMSAWGWLDRASRVRKGEVDPLAAFPNLRRLFQTVDARPAVARARGVGKDHDFKKVNEEQARRAHFPSNYPPGA